MHIVDVQRALALTWRGDNWDARSQQALAQVAGAGDAILQVVLSRHSAHAGLNEMHCGWEVGGQAIVLLL